MKRIDLKIWFACNNKCLFCVQWDKRYKYWPKSLDMVYEDLETGKKDGATWVVFTGGEPTIHQTLMEGIKYAQKIWYKEIQIQTNWRTFEDIDFCKQLIDAGANQFSPSLHGFKPETHDFLVGAPWAWKQTVQWLTNLKKLWQYVLTNTVITKQNYKELPKLALLLISLGVRQYQFAFIHITWSADVNKEEIVPSKTEIIDYVKKWLDIWKKYKVNCMTEAIPFCIMQWYEWAIAEYNFMPETQIFDAEWVIDSYNDYRWNEWKIKFPQCKSCKYNNICEGPWKEYPEIYWREEFLPVK